MSTARNHKTTSSSLSGIDADSLLASTLLRIRKDSLVNSNHHHNNRAPAAGDAKRVSPIIPIAPRSNNNNTQDSITPTSAGGQQQNMQFPTPNAATTNLNSASSRLGRGVSMAPVAEMFGINNNNSHNAYGSDHGITLEQINTLQALAANRAASLAAMAAAAAASSPLHRNAANFAAAAAAPSPRPLGHFDHLQTSSQHVAVSSSPTTSSSQAGQVVTSSRTLSVRQQLAAEVALHMSEQHDNNEATLAAAAAIVRKEQVEAALRSKPQRGRKREELSELERMELTRTRNREHARSTRIRKKARYQELLDCEQQLEDVLKLENVQQKRRRAILEFLALRCSMLLSVLSNSPDDPQHASINTTAVSSSKAIYDLVEDPDQFCFRFNEFNRPAAAALTLNSVQHMKNFDNHLVSRVVGIFGKAVLPSVSYSIKGSSSGGNNKNDESSSIAMDLGHVGFANVEISLVRPSGGNNEEKVLLMTGVMQFDFSESDNKSDKLRSVVWSTMRDFLNDLSDEGLNAQVSHPSVVSLDPAMLIQESASSISGSSEATKPSSSSQERQLEEGGGGPGMNI